MEKITYLFLGRRVGDILDEDGVGGRHVLGGTFLLVARSLGLGLLCLGRLFSLLGLVSSFFLRGLGGSLISSRGLLLGLGLGLGLLLLLGLFRALGTGLFDFGFSSLLGLLFLDKPLVTCTTQAPKDSIAINHLPSWVGGQWGGQA